MLSKSIMEPDSKLLEGIMFSFGSTGRLSLLVISLAISLVARRPIQWLA